MRVPLRGRMIFAFRHDDSRAVDEVAAAGPEQRERWTTAAAASEPSAQVSFRPPHAARARYALLPQVGLQASRERHQRIAGHGDDDIALIALRAHPQTTPGVSVNG